MDGEIDYSNYSLEQLREAEAGINRATFPHNFARLQAELNRRGASARQVPVNAGTSAVSVNRPPIVRTAVRVVVSLNSALATYWYVFWVGSAILFQFEPPESVRRLVSLASACLVAWFVWTRTAKPNAGLATAIFVGAIITGGIGFSAGFFGPVIFMPDANQGPLIGLIVTGPGGFVVGAVGGAVYWIAQGRRKANAVKNGAV